MSCSAQATPPPCLAQAALPRELEQKEQGCAHSRGIMADRRGNISPQGPRMATAALSMATMPRAFSRAASVFSCVCCSLWVYVPASPEFTVSPCGKSGFYCGPRMIASVALAGGRARGAAHGLCALLCLALSAMRLTSEFVSGAEDRASLRGLPVGRGRGAPKPSRLADGPLVCYGNSLRESGGTGRRTGLRIQHLRYGGSIPPSRTNTPP